MRRVGRASCSISCRRALSRRAHQCPELVGTRVRDRADEPMRELVKGQPLRGVADEVVRLRHDDLRAKVAEVAAEGCCSLPRRGAPSVGVEVSNVSYTAAAAACGKSADATTERLGRNLVDEL